MPRNRLWRATLSQVSPRYSKWRHILGNDDVPLKGPFSGVALLNGNRTEVYQLDLDRLLPEQHERLLNWISSQFSVSVDEVRRDLPNEGFPIRAEDVLVTFDTRVFL